MRIITISGVDGSGKSTQASLLEDYLLKNGEKVFRFHSVEFSIAQKLLPQKRTHASQSSDTGLSQTRASWTKILLRKIAFLIDIIRFRILLRTLNNDGYTVLLSDRFFFDNVINIRYLSGNTKHLLLERIVPHTDISFLLSIDPSTIMKRDRAPEQGLDYLTSKTHLFKERSSAWNLITIDADASKDVVFSHIKNYL